jgi:hypothetical protein
MVLWTIVLILLGTVVGIYIWWRSQHHPTIRTAIQPANGTATINFVPQIAVAAPPAQPHP